MDTLRDRAFLMLYSGSREAVPEKDRYEVG
jgi:hypothetical protein